MFKFHKVEQGIDEETLKPKLDITLTLDIEELEDIKAKGGIAYGDTEWASVDECIGEDFLTALDEFKNEKKDGNVQM